MISLRRLWSPGTDRTSVRRSIRRFGFGMAATLLMLVVFSLLAGRHIARDAALDEARYRTGAIADNLAAPLVTDAFRAKDPDAVASLTRVMENRMRDGSIRHIKIWSADGTILWADEANLIGRHFPLGEEEQEALEQAKPVADFSDLTKAENVEERSEGGPYVEVYAGTRGADGRPLLFETYISTDRISDRQNDIVEAMVAISICTLLVFAGIVFPLSLGLARGVQRARDDRERMTRRTLLSSELERRRIAQELHDGVVQDLAGVGYVMPGLVRRVRSGDSGVGDADALARIQDLVTRNVAALRSLMAEVYPPNLAESGLLRATEDLAMDSAGALLVEVRIPADLALSEEANQLAYRLVREGLRNVVKHARATAAEIEVRHEGGWVHVTVADNGVGVPPGPEPTYLADDGHLGLRLMADSVRDAGGRLTLTPHEPRGAVLRASFPEDVVGL